MSECVSSGAMESSVSGSSWALLATSDRVPGGGELRHVVVTMERIRVGDDRSWTDLRTDMAVVQQ